MASSTVLTRPWPVMRPQYAARTARISALARTAFWFIFVLSVTNIMAVVMRYVGVVTGVEQELGIYPVTFAICAALVLMFTKGQHHSPILVVAWIFWGIYAIGGFAGEYQLTGTYFRFVLEVIVKPWMTIVGLPWLALRAISEDKAPRLIQAMVLMMCLCAILAVMQVIIPGFMDALTSEPGRGAGFLLNPNQYGFSVACTLFVSFLYPFERRWLNFAVRVVLAAGLVASFSRASFLAIFVAWIVYGIATKRFATLLNSLLVVAVLIASTLFAIEVIETVSPQQAARFAAVRSFLQGEVANEDADNRTQIWRGTFDAIVEREGVIFGLGHGSMERIVPVAGGYSPHNYYLLVWGNSGIVALVGLLAFHFILFQQAFTCRRPQTRAALLAIATMFAIAHVFDHAIIGRPNPGAILACVVVAVAYGRRAPFPQRIPRRSLNPMFRPAMVRPAR